MTIGALKALRTSPVMEAIFEFRFQPAIPTAGDLFPGLLFAELRSEYPKVDQLPVATIPREMREKDPNLLYQPTHRLTGASRLVQVGDRAVGVAMLAPYPGWPKFKEAIVLLLRSVERTRLVREPERFSFRYINVIPVEGDRPQLPLLSVQTAWEGHEFLEKGFHLRFELKEREFTTVVQLTPNVTGKRSESLVAGLLVDVDTIREKPTREFWEADGGLLEDAHSVVKQTFFSLLTASTLAALGPVYDTASV
jgi:uncharacterized protein (TIGR04255 family)